MMMHKLDPVVLTHDIAKYGLKKGDVGAIVHGYKNAATFEVEFVTAEGKTVGVLTLTEKDVRPMNRREILHVREMASV